MRFGIRLHPFSMFPGFAAIVETVQRAEQLGYSFISIPEHTIFPAEHERTMGPVWYEAIALAAHLAAVTSRISFYTGALIVTQHNPIYLAKQAATLAITSNGRSFLGVAGGWLEQEIAWLKGAVRNRGKAVEEYIEVMRCLWRHDPAAFTGNTISFSNASFHPKPPEGRVPVFVCGTPRVSAPRAARLGEGWFPSSSSQAVFEENLAVLWQEMERHHRPRQRFSVIRNLTLYELPPEIKEHTRDTGAEAEPGFGGDLHKARDYARHNESLGVTDMLVLLSTRYEEFREQLETFAAGVISAQRRK